MELLNIKDLNISFTQYDKAVSYTHLDVYKRQVGIISIVFVNCSYLTWIIPLICCPFPMSMGLPIVTTAVGDYYGKKNFSIIWGFALPLTTLATIGISPLVGIMLAHFNSLTLAFVAASLQDVYKRQEMAWYMTF